MFTGAFVCTGQLYLNIMDLIMGQPGFFYQGRHLLPLWVWSSTSLSPSCTLPLAVLTWVSSLQWTVFPHSQAGTQSFRDTQGFVVGFARGCGSFVCMEVLILKRSPCMRIWLCSLKLSNNTKAFCFNAVWFSFSTHTYTYVK